MSFPDVVAAADFTSSALSLPTDWTVLPNRRYANIHQGRQKLLDRTEVGEATVTLDNRDRAFDPLVNPNVRPGNHFRIQAIHNEITYGLFRGFVRTWPQEWPDPSDAVAISRVRAEDAFSLLARYQLEGEQITETLSGDHLEQVLSLYGWPAAGEIPAGTTWWRLGTVGASELGTTTFLGENLRFLDEGTATIMTLNLEGNLLDHLLNVAEVTEGGTFYVGPSGDLIFRERPSPFAPSVGIWGDKDSDGFRYADLVVDYSNDLVFNDIRLTRRGASTPSVATETTGFFGTENLGARTLPREVLYATDEQADAEAVKLLARHRKPAYAPVRMVLHPKDESLMWPLVLGIELGTKITVRRRPPGGGDMIELDALVIGIDHDIAPEDWTITWDLAPTDLVVDAWYLGHPGYSELGTTTILA